MIEEKSLDIFAEKLAKLRELFPEVLSEGKIDFKRLQSVLGEEAFFIKNITNSVGQANPTHAHKFKKPPAQP